MSLAGSTNSNFSESRDEKGNLNYLKDDEELKVISDCDVVNLQIDKTSLHKLKILFRMNIIFSNSIFFYKKGGISRYFVNLSKQLNLLKVKIKLSHH